MKTLVFASRNRKEIVRDPITLVFGIGLPVVLLALMSMIGRSVPPGATPQFEIANFGPAMAVFSLSFLTLFAGILVAKDRTSSFLTRLFAAPLTAAGFLGGYTLPMLAVAAAQSAVCIAASFFFGLPVGWDALLTVAVLLPVGLLFVSLGLLLGSLLSDKAVGGVCGGLLVNAAALLSGTWFDLSLVGGLYETIGNALPFAHAVGLARAAAAGEYAAILPHLWWVLGYTVAIFAAAVLAFRRKMRG